MSSLKQNILDFLADQPDDVDADALIEFIYLHKKISKAQKALKEGKSYTLEEAKEMLEQWRN